MLKIKNDELQLQHQTKAIISDNNNPNNDDENRIQQLETQIMSLINDNTTAVNSLQEMQKIIQTEETKQNKSIREFQFQISELSSRNDSLTKDNEDLKFNYSVVLQATSSLHSSEVVEGLKTEINELRQQLLHNNNKTDEHLELSRKHASLNLT